MMPRAQEDLSGWTTRERPPREPIEGRLVRVEPFDIGRHASDLFEAYQLDTQGALWDYLPYGPFSDLAVYESHARMVMSGDDPFFHAIIDLTTGKAVGVASLMRIVPEHGVIEVGHICYSPLLQRTPASTETQYLLARRVFDELGYRRYEWKCDNANAPSRRAAARLGFSFEGLFRKHLVVKGKNRDTAWFSITDDEWPRVRQAYETWLDPENFDSDGNQRFSLQALNAGSLEAGGRTLRRADMADVETVVQFQKDAYAKTWAKLGREPIPLKWDYREVLARQEVWLMEEGGEPIGSLIVEPHGDHLYIESVAIHPDHCGKGLGNDLLGAAESRAGALGLSELRLITGKTMDNNIGWYERKGFEIAEVEQLPDRRIVHMRRDLG